MKIIMALIEPQKFPEVRQALFDIDVRGMTLSSAMGCSREVGFKETYRGVVSVIGTLAAAFITQRWSACGSRLPRSSSGWISRNTARRRYAGFQTVFD